MSLRVTKCHRAVIFGEAYLRARVRSECNSSSYRTMLQRPTITLSLFGDLTLFWFCNAISGDAETRSVGQYKVANCQISLTFHHGIKLSILLALGVWVNLIPNLIPSYWALKHSWAWWTKTSLRVTKCHREMIFDRAYLEAHVRYGCNFGCYKIVLLTPTIISLSFWILDSIFILRPHLG